MRTYKYKCAICKTLIEENVIHVEKQSKSGNKYIKRYHKVCLDNSVAKQKAKDAFYKYIQKNFFPVVIPKRLFTEMSFITCSYTDILECCKEIDLVSIVSKVTFNSDLSKVAYIVAVIRNSINAYIERKNINHTDKYEADVNDFI